VVSYNPRVDTPQYAAEVSLGRTLEGIGDDLYRMEDQQDTRMAEDGLTQLRRKQLDLTIGEQDGFTNVKSKAAVSRPLVKEYGAKFDDAEKQIAQGLTNERQKERFQKRADAVRRGLDPARHAADQGAWGGSPGRHGRRRGSKRLAALQRPIGHCALAHPAVAGGG
jgi:hypothetical protein